MGADNVHATKGERMYDTGSTTFMLICTMLVFLMTPGLAFFYGGLSRRKNVINTMLMCFGAIGLVGIHSLSMEELRKNVGLVFQTPALFPFSIYKNLT